MLDGDSCVEYVGTARCVLRGIMYVPALSPCKFVLTFSFFRCIAPKQSTTEAPIKIKDPSLPIPSYEKCSSSKSLMESLWRMLVLSCAVVQRFLNLYYDMEFKRWTVLAS